ncbi:MAG: hypothetical protein WCJ03_07220 [Bacteroidales bacterium]
MKNYINSTRPVGETFDYNGVKLIVAKATLYDFCDDCYFEDKPDCDYKRTGSCSSILRNDERSVIFKRLEP